MSTGFLKWGNPVTEREIKCLLKRTYEGFFFYLLPASIPLSELHSILQVSIVPCPATPLEGPEHNKDICLLCVALLKFFLFWASLISLTHEWKSWPVLFRLSSHHAVAFFPRRYVTFIREQGPVILRLTTDPLPGSSLASHTLNSHFLDTWAIRLSTNITDTWRQPAAEDRPGWQR